MLTGIGFPPSFLLSPDIVGWLNQALTLHKPITTESGLLYHEEIERLVSVISVLTHSQVPMGAITLDPSKNYEVISTDLHKF